MILDVLNNAVCAVKLQKLTALMILVESSTVQQIPISVPIQVGPPSWLNTALILVNSATQEPARIIILAAALCLIFAKTSVALISWRRIVPKLVTTAQLARTMPITVVKMPTSAQTQLTDNSCNNNVVLPAVHFLDKILRVIFLFTAVKQREYFINQFIRIILYSFYFYWTFKIYLLFEKVK